MSRPAFIGACFILLLVLHQDFWWKDDPTLVFGVLPVSLAYHVVWTLLVAAGWYCVVRFCWPVEEAGENPPDPGSLPPAAQSTEQGDR